MDRKRLTSREKWVNPYEVLLIGPEATPEEIKKKFLRLSLLVHPDKCRGDSRGATAFKIIESAHTTLKAPEKRTVFQGILREARERVEQERSTENTRRRMLGLPNLPEDTFDTQLQEMSNRIFREIEERQFSFTSFGQPRKRQREEEKRQDVNTEMQEEKEWERARDKRASAWRQFRQHKDKKSTKRKMRKFELRPPQSKVQDKINHQGHNDM